MSYFVLVMPNVSFTAAIVSQHRFSSILCLDLLLVLGILVAVLESMFFLFFPWEKQSYLSWVHLFSRFCSSSKKGQLHFIFVGITSLSYLDSLPSFLSWKVHSESEAHESWQQDVDHRNRRTFLLHFTCCCKSFAAWLVCPDLFVFSRRLMTVGWTAVTLASWHESTANMRWTCRFLW